MSEQKLCYGCMEPLGEGKVCACGYDQSTPAAENRLKPGTVLHERYLIGKELESNGEGITYIAFDKTVGCKVLVREYLPAQICSRAADSTLVNVEYDHLAQYKALMAEYTELNKALARLRSLSHLNPALDLISENNTTYAVFEYLEGRTLLEYLKENAGELSWNTVRRIFPPLFTSLSLLHNAGVLHRGISPETIYVTDKGELKLRGFCISAVRTNDTELDAELFDGYAAPEQYFADRQQGTWTDVYGICAVLYRILTGCRATDANARQDFDNLIPPNDMNPHVPEKVSDAIMKGLELDGQKRIQTVTDLVTLLFEDIGTDGEEKANATMQFRPSDAQNAALNAAARRHEGHRPEQIPQQPVRNVKPKPQQKEPTVLERIRAPFLVAVLFLLIVGIVIYAFIQIMKSQNGNSTPGTTGTGWTSVNDNVESGLTSDTTRGPEYNAYMPKLVGMNYPIKRDEMASFVNMEAEYVFSETVPKDQIIWQEIEEGAPFVSGSTVKVKVSRGTSLIEIPEYYGYRLQTYLDKLEELGFAKGVEDPAAAKKNRNNSRTTGTTATTTTTTASTTVDPNAPKRTVVFKPTVNYKFANGNVCGVDPKPGTKIDVLKEYEIVVYYANNPVITTASSTSSKWGTTVTTASGGGASSGSWSAGGNSGSTAQQPGSSTTKASVTNTPATSATRRTTVTTAAGQ